MEPSEIITNFIREVKRLDEEATKVWGRSFDKEDKHNLGYFGGFYISSFEKPTIQSAEASASLAIHYRQSAPKLAEALDYTTKFLNTYLGKSSGYPPKTSIQACLKQIASILQGGA